MGPRYLWNLSIVTVGCMRNRLSLSRERRPRRVYILRGVCAALRNYSPGIHSQRGMLHLPGPLPCLPCPVMIVVLAIQHPCFYDLTPFTRPSRFLPINIEPQFIGGAPLSALGDNIF